MNMKFGFILVLYAPITLIVAMIIISQLSINVRIEMALFALVISMASLWAITNADKIIIRLKGSAEAKFSTMRDQDN